jgi:plastocyanin
LGFSADQGIRVRQGGGGILTAIRHLNRLLILRFIAPVKGIETNALMRLGSVICCFLFASWMDEDDSPRTAQVVSLDECDPATFNAPSAVGADFCRNIALGASTTFSELFAKAAAGTPDPNWDFEPDTLIIKKGTAINAVNQGGEPHTFTKVARFGRGFIPGLNGPGEEVVPECAGGFSKVSVARTRILQGRQLQVSGLSKGEHYFQSASILGCARQSW